MSQPGVKIDIKSRNGATVITVPSAKKPEILLKVVQVLTDRNLTIKEAYFSSPEKDSFKHEFHVIDKNGKEITDEGVLADIRELKEPNTSDPVVWVKVKQSTGCTSFEIEGNDRPGFLSEVSDVLITRHKCNVVNAEVWTDNTCTNGVMQVTDQKGEPITDPKRVSEIEELLRNVLNGSNKLSADYKVESQRPFVNVLSQNTTYSQVKIRSKKRPKLLFDVIRTLTDMQYVVCQGNVHNEGSESYCQEYIIKDVKGNDVKKEAEKQRLVHYLEAAIEGRVSKAIKLELCTDHKVGLLCDVMSIFRDKKLKVIKAEVTTRSSKAVCTFYVCDASGCSVDSKIIESIHKTIGKTILKGVDRINWRGRQC